MLCPHWSWLTILPNLQQGIALGAARRYAPPPKNRGASTSVCGRVRTPQAAHGGRRWLSCHAYSLVRQLRHGTDRRKDRAIPKCPSWAKGIITISAGTLRNDTLLAAPCTNHKQNNQSCKKIAESRLEHSNSWFESIRFVTRTDSNLLV